MIIFLSAVAGLILAGLKPAPKGQFIESYCAPKTTARINGVFSVLIILSHAVGYLKLTSPLDTPYMEIRQFLGQIVVTTYLFYSGYGIMESIKKKGTPYIKGMPAQRIFKLWYHFAIVVVAYIALNTALGKSYTPKHIVLSLLGYSSVGNSNWYIFVILCLYILVTAAFLVFKKSNQNAVALFCVLTLVYSVLEHKVGLPDRFFETNICFPMGMIFSLYREKIENMLKQNNCALWYIFTALTGAAAVAASHFKKENLIIYTIFVAFGVSFIVLLSMKIHLKSNFFDWFGGHIFSFFILQRIPMIILKNIGLAKYPYIFIIISFILTMGLAYGFDKLTDYLDKIIYRKKAK